MANVSSNMIITDESLSQVSHELLGQEDVSITFSEILVGDGKYPLVDTSSPVLNHVYAFPVMEIKRTNNNILLTTTIDEDAHLTIKEIGLYCTFQDGSTHIFSKISGLSVAKKEDLAYNLIIQAKLDVNVVNTIAFPEIKVKDSKFPKYSDFDTVDKVYVYATENLERMVKTNALGVGSYGNGTMTEQKPVGVGYNKAQTYYLLQDKISQWEENFCASFDYTNIKKKFSKTSSTKKSFDKSLLSLYGSAEVSDDGKGSVQSISDITVENSGLVANSENMSVNVESEIFISEDNELYVNDYTETLLNPSIDRIEPRAFVPMEFTKWDFTVGFTTGTDLNNEETVLNFSNNCLYQPLILGLREGHCYLKLGGVETLQTNLTGSSQSILFGRSIEQVLPNFYGWTTKSNPINNIHGTVIGSLNVNNNLISDFSANGYVEIKKFIPSGNNWTIEFECTTGDSVNGYLFAFGKKTSNGIMGITCTLGTNVTINLSSNGESITDTLTSTSELTANALYNIKVTFNGEYYQLVINDVPEVTLASTDNIYSDNFCTSLIGTDYTLSSAVNPFNGIVNMGKSSIRMGNIQYWDGFYSSQTILLRDLIPSAESRIYDGEGYEISTLTVDNFFSGEIADSDLFNLLPNTKYLLRAAFDGHEYTVNYTTNRDFIEIFKLETDDSIGTVGNIVIGAQYNAMIQNYMSPYSDTLDLDEFDISFYKYSDSGVLEEKVNYNFNRSSTVSSGKDLLDYFYFPDYHYSYYKIKNLGYDNIYSYIDVYEGYLKGREDRINFNSSTGFSLCVNTYMPKNDSVIIAKGDDEAATYYFMLEKKGDDLLFSYSLGDEVATVKGEVKTVYVTSELPVSVFITISGNASPNINMYINNEFIASKQLSHVSSLRAEDYHITNVHEGNEYVKVLAAFDGTLDNDEMYYINRILNTTL